jgi:hypothetical protein
MRQIYEQSERVVVYLGEHIAASTTEFPIYRYLDDINSGQDLHKLPSSMDLPVPQIKQHCGEQITFPGSYIDLILVESG